MAGEDDSGLVKRVRTFSCNIKKTHKDESYVYLARTEMVDGWEEVVLCPKWFDKRSRGCTHPKGVIVAGSASKPRKVALINLVDDKIEYWHDLPEDYDGDAMGMVFDAGVLTVAGGLYRTEHGNIKKRRKVCQLNTKISIEDWKELPPLKHSRYDPVLLNVDKYLYVLGGGHGQLTCERMKHGSQDLNPWKTIAPLPEALDCDFGGGGVVINNTINIFTSRYFMRYSTQNDDWAKAEYKKEKFTCCTPALTPDGDIYGSVTRDHPSGTSVTTVENYNCSNNVWTCVYDNCELGSGAGRFLVLKY